MRWFLVSLVVGATVYSEQPPHYQFPRDSSILNAKTDLGAKGDGIADDTEALQKGLDLSCGIQQKSTKIFYLPKGTYRVTKSLIIRNALGPWFYGESRDESIIRLADGTPGVTAVLRTHPNEKGPTSADWFMRNLRNFTIDVGNNPETDGIRYYATNTGILQHVRVIGRGKVGINAGFLDQSGPNLVQDCEVDGFETGLLSQWIWGQTISRVTIRNCRQVGLAVSANSVAVEDLVVENTPLPIHVMLPNDWHHWSGVVSLVGARLTGKDSSGPAIRNQGVLYARNVQTRGFKRAIEAPKPDKNHDAAEVTEYQSHETKRLFDLPTGNRFLPIKREPAIAWENQADRWLCANDHGVIVGDNKDDTAALQKAIDEAARQGKTIVYLRGCGGAEPNWYNIDGEVRIHGSVRCLMGLGWARILGGKQGRIVVTDEAAAVVRLQNIDSFGGPPVALVNRSKQTMHVESCGVKIVGEGSGDTFVTDCPANIELLKAGQNMWCRHLNPEGDSDQGLVRNTGANLWILGMKCEGRGVRIATRDRGRTEVYGTFIYGPGLKEGDQRPLFDIDNATTDVYGLRELAFGGHCYFVKVREKQGTSQKSLGSDKEGGWIGWSVYRSGQPGK